MAPREFGIFVVVYTILLFANNLQVSAVTRPLNVLGAPLSDESFRVYSAYAATGQLILATVLAGLALGGAGIAFYFGSSVFSLLVALSIALFAWQMQEFVRQVRYTQSRTGEVFALDLISYGGQAVIIAGLWGLHMLTAEGTMYAIAITSALSALYGFRRLHLPQRGLSLTALKPSWNFGRWLLGRLSWAMALRTALPVAHRGDRGCDFGSVLQGHPEPDCAGPHCAQRVPDDGRAARCTVYVSGGRKALMSFIIPVTIAAAVPMIAYWVLIGVIGSGSWGCCIRTLIRATPP